MKLQFPARFAVALLVLGFGETAGAQDTGPLARESLAEIPFWTEEQGAGTVAVVEKHPPHEALQPPGTGRNPEHVGKTPPALIAEWPGSVGSRPDARWIEGYWQWDRSRKEFAWVTGTWHVPPTGKFWVNGYWRRDEKGWYRVPGFWSGSGDAAKDERAQEPPHDRRRVGLALAQPEEAIGMAPGPDFFYIPGEYVPGWGGVVWRPGFWARSQPGWEWIPARWDRHATGWVFRDGFWKRATDSPSPPARDASSTDSNMLVSTHAGTSSPSAATISNSAGPSNVVTNQNGGLSPFVGASTAPDGTMTWVRSGEPGDAQVASRLEREQRPGEPSQSGQGVGKPAQSSGFRQPSDPKQGPEPLNAQQAAYPGYGPQPMYYPGRPVMWNARSVVGFLRQFLP